MMTTKSGRGRRHLATSPFKREPEPPIVQYVVGGRVSHDTYGLGRVVAIEANAVTVDFGSRKVRIESPYRKMEEL